MKKEAMQYIYLFTEIELKILPPGVDWNFTLFLLFFIIQKMSLFSGYGLFQKTDTYTKAGVDNLLRH